MPKFKLICEHDEKNKLQHEFEEDFLSDAVVYITSFLKGCGYEFGALKVLSVDEVFSINPSLDSDYLYGDLDFSSPVGSDDDYLFEEDVPTVDDPYADIRKQTSTPEKCPICKIDKDIMMNHNCFDSSCPKGKVRGW